MRSESFACKIFEEEKESESLKAPIIMQVQYLVSSPPEDSDGSTIMAARPSEDFHGWMVGGCVGRWEVDKVGDSLERYISVWCGNIKMDSRSRPRWTNWKWSRSGWRTISPLPRLNVQVSHPQLPKLTPHELPQVPSLT